MALKRLCVRNLRNLLQVDVAPAAHVNLIYGPNGSGKTSLLEAINLLALGRSFRSHKYKPLIHHEHSCLTVFGQIDQNGIHIPIGVSRKADGEALFKVEGKIVSSAASLAVYLPIQVINSDTFLLLEGSPKVRRQFIDWLVFHVEPVFLNVWREAQRCLKQRNSLLRRDRMDIEELKVWDNELVELTNKIHEFRQTYVQRFNVKFAELIRNFLAINDIKITYYCGWNREHSYRDILAVNIERDRRLGSTSAGFHKADLKITIAGQNASEVLSRGQQKLLVCALKIAQGYVFSKITNRKPIYLVDDLPAELDEERCALLTLWLGEMNTQVFITGIDKESLLRPWQKFSNLDLAMFHVEQGLITKQ